MCSSMRLRWNLDESWSRYATLSIKYWGFSTVSWILSSWILDLWYYIWFIFTTLCLELPLKKLVRDYCRPLKMKAKIFNLYFDENLYKEIKAKEIGDGFLLLKISAASFGKRVWCSSCAVRVGQKFFYEVENVHHLIMLFFSTVCICFSWAIIVMVF